MEGFNRKLSEKNKDTKRCGQTYSGHTTGIRMGQERHSNTFKNSNRQNRLEWRC
tara:strand:+ start:445 stop:606 length:162 start_codon:yes stop_codon:yes gene_type:complete